MKAAVLKGVHEPVVVEEVEDPVAGPGEAVVRIAAAALNHRDVWIRKGQYAGLKFPAILGSDGAGVVESVGADSDRHWIGKEVVIDPSLGWGKGRAVQNGDTFRILGMPDHGTFAEKIKIPVENLYDKPPHMSFEEAAAIPLAALTAYRAVVTRSCLVSTDRVLVTGAGGGTATFAVQIAAAFGARVFVTSGSEAKIEAAKELGAEGGANYREEGWEKKLQELAGGGFDVIIDSAGGENFDKLLEIANPGGRIAFFGATAGNPPGLNMRRVFWKQLSLLGTTMGSPEDFEGMVRLYGDHRLRPTVDKVFPLEQANDALDRMERGEQIGKIVLRT